MSVKISQLPAATQVNATDLFVKSDQGGAPSQSASGTQIAAFIQNAPVTINTLTPTSGTSYTVDFSKPVNQISTAAQIDFTASTNRPLAGTRKDLNVEILPNGGGSRNFTFNASWVFLGIGAPTAIAASKTGMLSLTAYGPNETDIVAVWAVQP